MIPMVGTDSLLGAEGIRTAGPLCDSWRLRNARRFSGVYRAKADQRIVLRAICRQIRAENAGLRSLFKAEKAKDDRRFESLPLQQRGNANRRDRGAEMKSDDEPEISKEVPAKQRRWPTTIAVLFFVTLAVYLVARR